jgi:hypothetical protein
MNRIADYPDERLNSPNDVVIRPLVWWARWLEVLLPVLRTYDGDERNSKNTTA